VATTARPRIGGTTTAPTIPRTSTTPTATVAPPPDTAIYAVPVDSSPVLGKKDALVTIVEFSDFQCPFCKRAEPTLATLRAKYGDDLRMVWKDEPLSFHPQAGPSAELAREARKQLGDVGFWRAHDMLYASSPNLQPNDLDVVAESLGLNVRLVHTAIDDKGYQQSINEDVALANVVGAQGTPTFFINGRKLTGAQPVGKFEQIIDEELPKARALVASGTPRERVYDATIAKATVGRKN
jgi:protein-disulfide isomerase